MDKLIEMVDERLALSTIQHAIEYLCATTTMNAYAVYEAKLILEKCHFAVITGGYYGESL